MSVNAARKYTFDNLVTRATYDLPSDFNQSFAREVASLSLADAKKQLAKDLAEAHEVRIIRGEKKVGASMLQSVGVADFRAVP